MKMKGKMLFLIIAAVISILLATGIGSVHISPADIAAILIGRLLGIPLPESIDPVYPALVMDIRLPRVLSAFFTGSALAVCGAVMQSVLKNPLASPYSLGISAGSGLGAALVIVSGTAAGISGLILLPMASFSFGLFTMVSVMAIASRIDRRMSNTTIVLTGMVVSLFFSAIMDLLGTISPAYAQRINLWQLGSFSAREWGNVWILLSVTAVCLLFFLMYSREMDIMTFGEEQAQAIGVDLKKSKWLLTGCVAVLTGTTVAFAGIIGFVDLIAPHMVRRFFGSSHKRILPASALFGGTFMVLCDLAARTVASPREIPVGSITALIGAPFFFYVFFLKSKSQVSAAS